ncbi:Alpha,alpha-trehalose-phosphate synthase [UDP-forming] 2 [Penicillium rolfsii]|nr:Alpha,alpha-trehalose-phosphate synthase [UDP-forming] 2 [Penicillium rolfsii]
MESDESKRSLIIVSNRLPLSTKRVDGTYQSSLSSGGLVTALSGLTKSTKFRWFGWPGIEVKDSKDRENVCKSLAEHDATPIFLDSGLAHEHYNMFSNRILWPILHYQSGVVYEDGPWQAYRRVNELFADAVAEAAETGTLIWVHDYHLMLLPELLRNRLQAKNKRCAIGFFLHTPFPAGDFWRALPVKKHLLEGLLSSDLIGFHTDEYKQNFIDTCASILGARTEIPNQIQYKDRLVCAGRYIVGIDPQKFADTLKKPEVQDRIKTIEERYKGMKVIVGVDRLDYIKGLTQKLKGFDSFLDDHPELCNKVVLIQVAVPSREDVKEYQELETELSTLSGKINGKHATPEGTPLLYMHRSVPFTELTALYSVADVCLLSSTRDGMNLVSFEYVACQDKKKGVLVLSEFAGSATFMREGSIPFHPANTTEMSEALYTALNLAPEERQQKHEFLSKFVNTHTSAKWGQTFIEKLAQRCRQPSEPC